MNKISNRIRRPHDPIAKLRTRPIAGPNPPQEKAHVLTAILFCLSVNIMFGLLVGAVVVGCVAP